MNAAVRTSQVVVLTAMIASMAAPARAQWMPPIGIPAPAFGITQTAPATPNPWSSPTPGFYFVEQKAGATNVNNPYGTPAKPRISIPNPLPAGSVVELHGFYDQSQSSPNGIVAQGTASAPAFIRGASPTDRPLIRRNWEVTGTYLILENLEFGPNPDGVSTGALVIREPSHFIAIRNSDLHGTPSDGGMGVVNYSGGTLRTQNVIIFRNKIHDNGDINASFDQDVHGIVVASYADHVWVLENEMYRNSGDGIQINGGTNLGHTTHHIYVGRNTSHHNKQTGFWVKQATDVMFSQNYAYSHRPGNSSMGQCMGGQYAPDYVWWLFNRITDCEFGIALMSDLEANQISHQYFVGNVIFNIHETTLDNTPEDPWSPAAILLAGGSERHVVNNTIHNIDSGVNIPSSNGSVEVKNNIINNVTQGSGNHVNFGFASVGNRSAMDHNLFFPTPRIGWDGGNFLLSASQMASMRSIAQSPQFRNAAASDFHITSTSPAAAAGELSAIYNFFQQRYGFSIFVDADGSPRPQTTWMDIGAYSSSGWGFVAIDNPVASTVVGTSFTVSGWAIDRTALSGTGVDAVHVYAFPAGGGSVFLGVATYGQSRPDVGAAYGSQFSASGYTLNVTGMSYGAYTLIVYAHSATTGGFTVASSVPITVSGPVPNPAISLGAPLSNSTSGSTVTVNGWALDAAALSGTGVNVVHVYAFPSGGGAPVFMGVATYGGSRPDVAALFGSQFTNSGFQLQAPVAPGNYTIVAYMRSTVSNTFNAVASVTHVTVNSTNSNPMMMMDGPPTGSTRTRPFVISGWAVDTGAASGTGIDTIHIWAFPVSGAPAFFVGVGTYGTSRPDVGAYLGDSRYNNSGFTFAVTSGNMPAPGTYDFQIFGRSTVTGTFSLSRVVRVTVQ